MGEMNKTQEVVTTIECGISQSITELNSMSTGLEVLMSELVSATQRGDFESISELKQQMRVLFLSNVGG